MANHTHVPKGKAFMSYVRSHRRAVPLAERFWAKVDKRGPDECWPWTGSKTKGHGNICGPDGKTMTTAHRVSLMVHGIDLIPGYHVDHICRNRACQNPAHLRQVTPGQNTLENSISPSALAAAKTECKKGHPFSGANLALYKRPGKGPQRICLTCQPAFWRFAVVPRTPPAGAHRR